MTTIFTSRLDDDSSTGLSRRSLAGGRREADQDPEQPRIPTWREMAAIVGVVSMAFTVGYNWKELTTLHAEYDRHVEKSEKEHAGFMPRELSNSQYQEIQRQLIEINRLLEKADRRR